MYGKCGIQKNSSFHFKFNVSKQTKLNRQNLTLQHQRAEFVAYIPKVKYSVVLKVLHLFSSLNGYHLFISNASEIIR